MMEVNEKSERFSHQIHPSRMASRSADASRCATRRMEAKANLLPAAFAHSHTAFAPSPLSPLRPKMSIPSSPSLSHLNALLPDHLSAPSSS